MFANIVWGTPDCKKTSLISGPETYPSLSISVSWNKLSNCAFSSGVTTHGTDVTC